MKRKRRQELLAKKIGELKNLVQEAERELVKLRMEKASSRGRKTTELREKRQEIAIIKTLIRKKQLSKEAI